jgi:nitrite reductase/ring-hydroxylating ferredoxin subunit
MQGVLLICSNHGAIFLPESGRCIGGPCNGRNLVVLPVEERDGKVIFKEFEHGGRR